VGTEGFGPRLIELPFGLQVTETVTVTWYLMAAIILLAWLGTRNMKMVPGRVQIVVEMLVKTINNLVKQTMGEQNAKFAPYIGTLMIFLAVANLAGLIGLRPPTADINTTLALALITFTMIHGFSVRSKGIGNYVKGYFQPFALLFPINLLGELATPISLSFRLFGNIVGGMIIMSLMYGALTGLTGSLLNLNVPLLAVGLPAVFHVYFDVFSGLLQSFIFCMLTMVFVSMGMD
jgi:F-type H+-transporting ATPase subunit a